MKLLLKITLALLTLSTISSLIPSPLNAWSQDVAYESCAHLRADWPAGLARSSKAITQIPRSFVPPRISTDASQFNPHLDRDENGVMCANKTSAAIRPVASGCDGEAFTS